MRNLVIVFVILGVLLSAGLLFAEEQAQPGPPTAANGQEMTVKLAPAPPTPPKIDTGDTAWMIVATAMVMLMSIPGLALFYGGLANGKAQRAIWVGTLAVDYP